MSDDLLVRKEMIEKAKISEKLLNEWEELKIINPSGFTDDKIPFYTLQTVEYINKMKKFLDIGYTHEEIQKILKKVGLPKNSGECGEGRR